MPRMLPRPNAAAALTFGKNPTAAEKMANVGKKFGYKGIAKQQGSSRVIYDYLPFDGRELFKFFRTTRNRDFPFTNLSENKLQVGESLVIERMYLSIITTDAVTGNVTASLELEQAGLSNIYRSDMSFMIGTSQVLKPMNVQSFQSQFNRASRWGSLSSAFNGVAVVTAETGNVVWHADSLLAIPTLIEFEADLQVDGYTPVANMFLGMTMEGHAAILSPKHTF